MSPSAPSALAAMVGKVVDNGSLCLLGTIGTGAFGTVFSALDLESACGGNARTHAVKSVPDKSSTSKPRRREPREVRYHRRVSEHTNVVALHRVFYEPGYCCIVLDMLAGGDLVAHIEDKGTYVGDDAATKRVLLQMIDAVYQAHTSGVAHRDIKPENFLCSPDGGRVVLADFGLAARMGVYYEPSRVGTESFRAPEIIDEHGEKRLYDAGAADVYALVVSMAAVLTGVLPWDEARRADADYDRFCRFGGRALCESLPLTEAVVELAWRGLSPLPGCRSTLPELRRAVAGIERFWPHEHEVARAGERPAEVMRKYVAVRTTRLAKERRASRAKHLSGQRARCSVRLYMRGRLVRRLVV